MCIRHLGTAQKDGPRRPADSRKGQCLPQGRGLQVSRWLHGEGSCLEIHITKNNLVAVFSDLKFVELLGLAWLGFAFHLSRELIVQVYHPIVTQELSLIRVVNIIPITGVIQ